MTTPATYLSNLKTKVSTYRSHGDMHHIHEFGDVPEGDLGKLLEGAVVRVVPGAIIAAATYQDLVFEPWQRGATPQRIAVEFHTPALFTKDYTPLVGQVSGKTLGSITVTSLGQADDVEYPDWVERDLYSKIGALWQDKGRQLLAEGKVPLVSAISIGGLLPEEMVQDKTVELYGRAQVAFGVIPMKLFLRSMREYLRIRPEGLEPVASYAQPGVPTTR